MRSLPAAETPDRDQVESRVYRLATVPADAREGLGAWIWSDKTYDHQICRLWKDFEIPADAKVTQARLRIVVDDGYQLYLNGRELAQGANWRSITEYDLRLLLKPGRHVLAINAFNDYLSAGMILNLRVELSDGRGLDFKSDETWKVVPEGVRNWEKLKRAPTDWPELEHGVQPLETGLSEVAGQLAHRGGDPLFECCGDHFQRRRAGLNRSFTCGCSRRGEAADSLRAGLKSSGGPPGLP